MITIPKNTIITWYWFTRIAAISRRRPKRIWRRGRRGIEAGAVAVDASGNLPDLAFIAGCSSLLFVVTGGEN
jgi:hypothetical protein